MYIRDATPQDNEELQELQAKCPVGTTLIVSMLNTPDFFARAKAYESWKVFVACEDDRIVGSGACAIRDGIVGGEIRRVGYQFQAFTSPDHRRQGVGTLFHRHVENYLASEGVALSYLTIIEGNVPAMRLVESHGFELHRTLVMSGLMVFKEMDVAPTARIRPVESGDLSTVARLLNETWDGYELYEPTSAEALGRFIERTPHYSLDNLIVLEDGGRILACLGCWDWSQITQMTMLGFSRRMRMFGLMLDVIRFFRPIPSAPRPGDTLKQMVLTPIGFKGPEHLGVLVRHVNNQALERGIGTIFSVCERDDPLLASMKGFTRIDTGVHLYIKPLQGGVALGDNPVYVDGIDL